MTAALQNLKLFPAMVFLLAVIDSDRNVTIVAGLTEKDQPIGVLVDLYVSIFCRLVRLGAMLAGVIVCTVNTETGVFLHHCVELFLRHIHYLSATSSNISIHFA